MINLKSEIYAIRPRGAALNAACQWILKHKKLAWRLVVLPSLIEAVLLLLASVYFKLEEAALLIAPIIVVFLNSEFPYMMMNVVENPEDYDYPNRIPRMGELKSIWWKNFKSTIVISIIGALMWALCLITIFGPFIVTTIIPFALAIRMREDRGYMSCFAEAFRLAFTNFATFCITILGITLISISLILVPISISLAILVVIQSFVNKSVLEELNAFLNGNFITLFSAFVLLVSASLAMNIILIIYNFFYGHCKESNDHPVLISRMEEL